MDELVRMRRAELGDRVWRRVTRHRIHLPLEDVVEWHLQVRFDRPLDAVDEAVRLGGRGPLLEIGDSALARDASRSPL